MCGARTGLQKIFEPEIKSTDSKAKYQTAGSEGPSKKASGLCVSANPEKLYIKKGKEKILSWLYNISQNFS